MAMAWSKGFVICKAVSIKNFRVGEKIPVWVRMPKALVPQKSCWKEAADKEPARLKKKKKRKNIYIYI